MENNKDNSVKETEQKPQEQTEGKTGGKTMAEKAIDRFAQMMVTRLEEMKGQQWEKGWIDGGGRTAAIQDIMTSSSSCIPLPTAMMYPSMPPISR